jgi:hypothetical protein
MTIAEPLHLDELIPEIERYLAAVELFRSEGCEPHWAREDAGLVHEQPREPVG